MRRSGYALPKVRAGDDWNQPPDMSKVFTSVLHVASKKVN
jgi:hypothetical protein